MAAAVFTPEEHIAHLPLYATPKIDGIRFYVQDGVVWSRSNKPIRNVHIQRFIPLLLPSGCDGEFLVGESSAEDHFQQTSSVVMSDDKPINGLHTFVFDRLDPSILHVPKYSSRIAALLQWRKDHAQIFLAGRFVCHTSMDVSTWQEYDINSTNGAILYNLHQNITVLRPVALRKPADIDTYLTRCLSQGYEGIMLRRPDGGYKFGRATSKQAWLLKHKPLEDSEAIVIGFEELMRNENEAFKNEVGHTKDRKVLPEKSPEELLVLSKCTYSLIHQWLSQLAEELALIQNSANKSGTIVPTTSDASSSSLTSNAAPRPSPDNQSS